MKPCRSRIPGSGEGCPQSTITVAIAGQQDFFGRDLRNTERVILENQFVKTLSVDERSEEAGTVWVIKIDERAQLNISSQCLSQQRLVVAIRIASASSLRAVRAHLCLRGRFYLFESLVAET